MMKRLGICLVLLHSIVLGALGSTASAQVTLTHNSTSSCAPPCSATAVIFLHGLTGSEETWVNSESRQSFPVMLAEDSQLKDKIDVYTLRYQSLWNSGPPVVQVTSTIAAQLDPLFKEKRYSKVVFVAHSLGGNIASEYLVHVKLKFGHAALSRFPLVITLGTPFQGASLASLANFFSNNEQIRSLLEIRKNDFLQLLTESREDIVKKRLTHHCAPLDYAAGFETLPVSGRLLVVSQESATAGATRQQGFAKDHISLPKPPNQSDGVYSWVKGELATCLSGQNCRASSAGDAMCSLGDF
jgi:pimeloyl-ACP methyl ester carboxylesterase